MNINALRRSILAFALLLALLSAPSIKSAYAQDTTTGPVTTTTQPIETNDNEGFPWGLLGLLGLGGLAGLNRRETPAQRPVTTVDASRV